MPVLYDSFQSVLKDKNGKQLFSKQIAAYSSLSSGDVKNTLDNLVTVVGQHLQSSESVTLDGFGTFRLVMKSNGKGVETAEDVSAAQSSLTIRFLPCSTRHLDGTMATRSMVIGVRCVRFDRADASVSGGGGNTGSGSIDYLYGTTQT